MMILASEWVFVIFQRIWPIRSRDLKRKYNFKIYVTYSIRKTIISIAPYQDSKTACVFYNLFVHLIKVIFYILLTLVGVVLAAAIVLCGCDSYHRGIRATFDKYCCKNKNETDEKKNDENKEATEPNECMLDN